MVVLASASPRRLELLRSAGFTPLVDPADLDETPDPSLSAEADALRLARGKAELVAARHPQAMVLGADTIVVVDGAVLGKPRDAAMAEAMLRRLSDRGHYVVTAVHLVPPRRRAWPAVSLTVSTAVVFRRLEEVDVAGYVASGDWEGKAGAYAIQGLAAGFVRAVMGSYTNVVGLPLAEVVEELRRLDALPGAAA